MKKVIYKLVAASGIAIVALFAVYWFNLENKFLYHVINPLLQKNYDRIEKEKQI